MKILQKQNSILIVTLSKTGQCKDWSFCATYNPATSCQFIQMYCPMKCCKHFNKCVEMGCENPPVEDATTTTKTVSTMKPATLSTTLAIPIKEPIIEEPSAPLTTCCAGNSCEQVILDLSSPVIPFK